MSRPVGLHICLAFCSLLLLHFATQCLAFPKMEKMEIAHVHAEKGQSEKFITDDLENSSISSKQTPQLVISEDPEIVSAGPSATSFNKVFSVNKEARPTGAEYMQPVSHSVNTATEPAIPTGEEVFGSSQPEGMSPESRLFKTTLTIAITATASLNIGEKEEAFRSTSSQSILEETTEATQGFLKYVDDQLFATESQEGASLGHSLSSYVNTKEMLTTSLRTEKFGADIDHRTTYLPSAEPTAGTEHGKITPDREKPSQMTTGKTQASAIKQSLATSEYTLHVESETDSLLGVPEVTVSVSTAVPAASVFSDEWDDTKLENVGQIRTAKFGDNEETQERMETSQTAQVSHEVMGGGQPWTEASEVALGLPEGETHTKTALLMVHGQERSPAFSDQSSFTPTSLMEDIQVSVVNLLQTTEDFLESTKENDAMIFLETTVSVSEYESEAYQLLGNTMKDIITQEMTTAIQEPEATLSLETQEQVSTLEVTRDSGKVEEDKETSSPVSDVPGGTQLSRRWEPLATAVSTTAFPLSPEVTPAVEEHVDTVTGSDEEFTPVLGSPVTPPGIMVEAPSISPVLPSSEASSETTVIPSTSRVNTVASYGLDQLESEEGEEDEDEEDEEDEDEEEEDEEEDEEDKDADSLDEGLDGDTELPGFTLPGVTSQEPGVGQGNLGLLEGATYQVPDAIEWEQQNQGL
ncbi:uncharacterized protein C14orf37 homolog, partial [Carlito syrichta]|uniref:Uncharacterized protein C14orf37 homolog n=1 Tax=Carlito syrichta TaxID=1868482 RepID=A0A1U7TAP7_CARSF